MEKRLSKALAAAGVASRRACEELIFSGRVKVNSKKILLPQTMVDWERDEIFVDGKRIIEEEKKKYFLLNKPLGYICSNKCRKGGKIISHLFEQLGLRLFTAGRLDKETTGLLIVTNDGNFANRVIHPSSNIEKEYLAKTNKELTHQHLLCISKGVFIEGTFVKPVSVKKVRKGTVKIVVKEGKKHEVRELLKNANLEVLELKRIRIGNLRLGSLLLGKWREMTKRECERVLEGS